MTETEISPRALHDRLVAGTETAVLDIRNRDEFERWHITGEAATVAQVPQTGALSARVQGTLPELVSEAGLAGTEPVVVVCARGEASEDVAAGLRDAGIAAVNLAGGMAAWGDLLVAREVPGVDGLVQYERPASGCLSYLLVDGEEAAVVDPLLAGVDRYVADADRRGVTVRWAVDTHVHADHVSGVRELASRSGTGGVLPAGAVDRGLTDAAAADVELLADGESLQVGDRSLAALAAPGHTTELLAYRWGPALLTGDALFLDGVGRPDLEGGDERAPALAASLYETLTGPLAELPGETVVAPGHATDRAPRGAEATLVAGLATVRDRIDVEDRDRFVRRVTEHLSARPANYERIVAVNLGRDQVTAETAAELELGPNNCAVVMADPGS